MKKCDGKKDAKNDKEKDEKKEATKTDGTKKKETKQNEKTGLPLLDEFQLFENDVLTKATTVRANRLQELDEDPGEKFLSFVPGPIHDETRRYMVVVEEAMQKLAFFQCCIVVEEDSRRMLIEKLVFHEANFKAYRAVTKAISKRCGWWKTNMAVAIPSTDEVGFFRQVGFDTPDEDVQWLIGRHSTEESEELLVFRPPNYHKDNYRPPENLPEEYELTCDVAKDMAFRHKEYENSETRQELTEELKLRRAKTRFNNCDKAQESDQYPTPDRLFE